MFLSTLPVVLSRQTVLTCTDCPIPQVIIAGQHEQESELPHIFQDTPWKTSKSPENQWLEDAFPTEIVPF